jgi:hypothetical protein
LRANHEVVAALARAIDGRRRHALLLGVTPELSAIAEVTTAVDRNPDMIARVWPGDTPSRRAVLGDWRDVPLEGRQFSAAIGDGSFNRIRLGDYQAVFAQLERLLEPGGRLAVRVCLTPDSGESVEQVCQEATAGNVGGFHAFRWRLAMAMAAEQRDADVPVGRIHQVFEAQFPHRAALASATGWAREDVAEIDDDQGCEGVMSFPTRCQLRDMMPASFRYVRFLASGTYELSGRCPILVAESMS